MSQVNDISSEKKASRITGHDLTDDSLQDVDLRDHRGQFNKAFFDIDDEDDEIKDETKEARQLMKKELVSPGLWEAALSRAGLLDHLRNIRPYTNIFLALLFHVYLAFAILHHVSNDLDILWCDGLGFVLIVVLIVHLCYLFSFLHEMAIESPRITDMTESVMDFVSRHVLDRRCGRLVLYALFVSIVLVFLLVDTAGDPRRLTSAGGIVVLLFLGLIFSKHPRHISWRQVSWGMVLQFVLAVLILRLDLGRDVLECLGRKVETFLAFTDNGSKFAYGYLVSRTPFIPDLLEHNSLAYNVTRDINAARAVSAVVAFSTLSVVYFFSFAISVLTYLGVIKRITVWLGHLFKLTVGTTACESVSAAANIFLGLALAPLLIKPYLGRLTLSEIHCVMCGGFASIAGVVMAAYISFGIPSGHLLCASFLSAPASLAFAKLLYPETEESNLIQDVDLEEDEEDESKKDRNVLSEATQGAMDAAILVLNLVSLVIAFIASISFLNALVSFFAGLVGFSFVTFEWLLGKAFVPLAFLMGVDWAECEIVGRLVGIKTVASEFIAYQELGQLIRQNLISPRSASIATYALCGFSNPLSIGMTLAALGAMCPARKADFARVVVRAFVAGAASCFVTACVAGALMSEPGVEALGAAASKVA